MVKSTKRTGTANNPDMKNIVKRGECSFRVRVYCNGHYTTSTFDTLKDAQIWRDRVKANQELDTEKRDIQKARITQREAKTYTLKQALERYAEEVTPAKKGSAVELTRINKTKKSPLVSKSFYLFTPDDALALLDEIGGSDNNKRKYASLISHLYKTAHKLWRMDVKNPVAGEIELPSNGKPRDRRLQGDEGARLLRHLSGEAKAVFEFAIETAMRRSEILSLEWKNINLNLKVRTAILIDTKNSEPRAVPLSSTAIRILKGLKKGNKRKKPFSITISQLRDAWEAARTNAGIPDIRLHDMRHEGASRLFEKGLNVMEAASVTGHKTLSMLKRYTHLNPTDIAKKLG
jgi:integrase